MKRLVVVIVVIVGIVGACVFTFYRVNAARDEVNTYTNAIFAAIEVEDIGTASGVIDDFVSYWSEEEHKLIRVVRHAQIDEITKSVAKLQSMARYEAYHELSAELSAIVWQMEHIWESEIPRLSNILQQRPAIVFFSKSW